MQCACEAPKQTASCVTGGTIAFALPFIFVLTMHESIGKQEWLASMNSAALPWSGVVRYAAAICHNGDRLKQRLCNLLDWAAPLNQFLQDVIKAATGACDIEWTPWTRRVLLSLLTSRVSKCGWLRHALMSTLATRPLVQLLPSI
jgi:hypothetical protein